MKLLALVLLLLAPLRPAQTHVDYAVGQVWEYRTRPQDQGSLLRIQRVEDDTQGRPIYHISVIGLTVSGVRGQKVEHLPVSRETLDASVTRLSDSKLEFPDPTEGIAIWRADNGGVFTIPMAEIVAVIDRTIPARQ